MARETWWKIAGGIAVIGGIVAIWNPFAGSIAAEVIIAWAFILSGVTQLIGIFTTEGWGSKLWLGLIGALGVYLGVSLLGNPLEGLVTLTTAAGILLIVSGISRIMLGIKAEGSMRWTLILSAAVTLLLAYLILAHVVISSASFLGIYLGIELIFAGIAMLGLAGMFDKVKAELN